MTLLSCITTAFNDASVLHNSVDSILNQTFEDFQLIIVDDGSSDDTWSMIAAIDDDRVLGIRQANDGLSGARNKALEQVTGDYVCFLDADDTRPNYALDAIARKLRAETPDVLFSRGVLSEVRGDLLPFYDSGLLHRLAERTGDQALVTSSPLGAELLPLIQMMEPQSANKVVRTAMLRQHRLGFPNTHFFEDILFHTQVLARAERVSFLDMPCYTYFRRYGRPQITSASSDLRLDILPVVKMTLELFERSPHMHNPAYRTAVLMSCFKIARWCGSCVSHHYRFHFNELAAAIVRMMNPLYLHFPDPGPADPPFPRDVEAYVRDLAHG